MARDLVGVLAVEQELQGFRLPAEVAPVERIGQQRLLRLERALALARLGVELGEPPAMLARLASELAQLAVRLRDRALRFAQRIDASLFDSSDAASCFCSAVMRPRSSRSSFSFSLALALAGSAAGLASTSSRNRALAVYAFT